MNVAELAAIPADMRALEQWVVARLEQRDGKTTKVPYSPLDPDRKASSTDPATWATFEQAIDAADWLGLLVGFVFTALDPYCGVDLDAGLPDGDRGVIMSKLESYTETSVSGAGAHVIVRAALPAHARNRKGPLEVYDQGRYFVMTGRHVRGTPATVEDRQAELDEVLAHYLPAPEPPPLRPPRPIELDDRDLLERAFAARNGADFQQLYRGDTVGFASRSEADLAFCRTAAFWTGRDPTRVDAWLRSSGLMRDKWERADYRERTIAAAIAATADVYNPRPAPRTDPADANPAQANTVARPWRSVAWSTFRDDAPAEHRWLVDGLLPAGALCFVAGPPKRGKTWIGISLALALALGVAYAGEHQVLEPRDVLYVALEGSQTGLRTRIGALARGHGTDPDSSQLDRLHMLYRPRPFDLAQLATADWLLAEATELDAALVVVDVLRAAARFQENVAEDFARIRDHLDPLLTAGRTVALLHHFGKLTDTQKERSPGERMAGTGAMYGALDVGFLITRSDDGARQLSVLIEARDFAAPDALDLKIDGEGHGKHGGFTYADTATLVVDETVKVDLLDKAVDWFDKHPEWLAGDDLGRALEVTGRTITGAIKSDTEAREAAKEPPRLVQWDRDPRELGPKPNGKPWHPSARPYGSPAMLADFSEWAGPGSQRSLGELGPDFSVPPKGGNSGTEKSGEPVSEAP